jgi:hypothetical protein
MLGQEHGSQLKFRGKMKFIADILADRPINDFLKNF